MTWSSRLLGLALLVITTIACGDVPHPPKRLATMPDAGHIDPSDAASDTDAPMGPLPLSDECTRCGTTPCLEVGVACVGDPTCQPCFADVLAPGCLQNPRLVNLGRCACTNCFDACRTVCEATRSVWDTRFEPTTSW
jgi:hypothetical protein